MGLFRARSNRTNLPPNIVWMMEKFGRFEWDPRDTEVEASQVWNLLQAPLMSLAQADPGAFVTALATDVLPAGGWAVYGASHTLDNVLPSASSFSDADAIHAASLEFLRTRGVQSGRLTGWEWQFWLRTRGQAEPWGAE